MNGQDACGYEPRIAIIGVGGAGCNVLSSFYGSTCSATTIAINTDKEALKATSADKKLYICKGVLHGEGANGDSVIGKRCADIHEAEIREALTGFHVAFIIAGLGGGTGSGASSVVLDIAQSAGLDVHMIAINPFFFEAKRVQVAKESWSRVRALCQDSVLVCNDKIFAQMPDLSPTNAFDEVNASIRDHVLEQISGIEVMWSPGTDMDDTDMLGRIPSNYPLKALIGA